MNRLLSLEYQHRLEEVCERFGFFARPLDSADATAGLLVPAEQFARLRVAGRRLTPARLRNLAFSSALECDEKGLHLTWQKGQRSPQAMEEALLRLFGLLLPHDPAAFLERPRREVRVPTEGTLPESAVFLERFYGKNFLPREKKAPVIDLARSQGPYLRSVDADPLQIIDAASQIASLAAGVRPDAVQRALDDGEFDALLPGSPSEADPAAAVAFAGLRDALLKVASPGLEHVCFTNGGSEANEKALHLARLHGPGGRRVLAFEGAFHGRTLVPLYATWNPAKRAAFQIPGFEATFLKMPWQVDPYGDPPIPAGWRTAWADPSGPRAELRSGDAELDGEIEALCAVEASILEGDVMAVLVEPYQCEGGDQSASRRFFHGLRALTRGHGVPLIFDEVQSGFGLSGKPFWHQRFKLIDAAGKPDGPDLVTGAKRAQVGYVLSRWPDPSPTPAHAASALRGRLHLEYLLARPGHEARARQQLSELMGKFGDIFSNPRAFGDAFAIDLPNNAIANHLIAQRFYRGYMVYIAGERTLRYRLNRGMSVADVDRIFDVIEASTHALIEQAGGRGEHLIERMTAMKAPAWAPAKPTKGTAAPTLAQVLADASAATADRVLGLLGELCEEDRENGAAALGLSLKLARGDSARAAITAADPQAFEHRVGVSLEQWAADALGTRVRRIAPRDFDGLASHIKRLEEESYEPARRDSLAYLRTLVEAADSVCLVAEDPTGLLGIAFAAPLELFGDQDGPLQDPHRGRNDTLYSADITVSPRARRRGLGRRLRVSVLGEALKLRDEHARPRYAYVTGRNRVGRAEAMWRINQAFGAYEVDLHMGQYGELEGIARYYRIPLRRADRRAFSSAGGADRRAFSSAGGADRRAFAPHGSAPALLDFAEGIRRPTGAAHPSLVHAAQIGVFDEPALTKLTVSNFITPAYARAAEYLQAIAPAGNQHLYFTSCQDEMVDKSLRALKHQRGQGRIAVGFAAGFFGTATAASRSLSGGGGTAPDEGYFGWPILPHPNANPAATVAALDALVAAEGAEALLGVYIETVQERTGVALSNAAWQALCAWRDRTGVPLVLSETTTGLYRNGRGRFFWVDTVSGDADIVLWWAGGQTGHVFSNDRTYVSTPLTLISTWDGDELSATRLLWQMYAAGYVDPIDRSAELEATLVGAGVEAGALGGLGLYRTLHLTGDRAARLQTALAMLGVQVGRPQPDTLAFAPPITVSAADLSAFGKALRTVMFEDRQP